ncbi:MAG: hypothetical protein M3019_04820 [Candidatus Dormibacteraeota bacterium]|nr:hypothetical protein [Candidatus Dormibacteraeota bacterium]
MTAAPPESAPWSPGLPGVDPGVGVPLTDGVGVPLRDGVGVPLTDGVGVPLTDGVGAGVQVPSRPVAGDGTAVGEGSPDADWVRQRMGVGETKAFPVAIAATPPMVVAGSVGFRRPTSA